MKLFSVILSALAVEQVAAVGFAIYHELLEGQENSGNVAYSQLDDDGRADTMFLYIQIIAGSDHTSIIEDFKTLAKNYGGRGVRAIPRVRYGTAGGDIATEPDETTLMADVEQWATVFSDVSNTIDMPVVQAGFLGQWGEWHDGPFCQFQGTGDSADNQRIKKAVVNKLQASGHKIALRYPLDHQALFNGDRSVTIHDDCILNEGLDGTDGWTFPPKQKDALRKYTKQVAGGNTFGGEGCKIGDQEDYAGYDWNADDVCGSNGLVKWINDFQAAYLNPYNPREMKNIFNDPSRRECVDEIQQALESHS
jgi:hypothetical protein